VFAAHLQAHHGTNEHGKVHVLVTVSFRDSTFAFPFRVICEIQLLDILMNTRGIDYIKGNL
jgi:hypothetical protein